MKTATSLVLLLAASFPTVFGAPFSSVSARSVHQPTEEEIRAQLTGTALYSALEDAFSKVNSQGSLGRRGDLTRNDLEQGKCAPNIFIYARGTTEKGNMGDGIPIQDALDAVLSNRIIYQGVNE